MVSAPPLRRSSLPILQDTNVVANTGNRKLGNAAATYRPVPETCPSNCQFIEKGCYSIRHPCRCAVQTSRGRLSTFVDVLRTGQTLIRHHVSGDVFANDRLDRGYVRALVDFHRKYTHITGWLYTHRIRDWDRAGFTSDKIPSSLVVLASCDSEKDVQYALENGWRYARVSRGKPTLDRSRNEIYCPFDRAKDFGKSLAQIDVTCARCRLCFDEKKANVVFTYQ